MGQIRYIGARYIPQLYGDWDISLTYPPLSVVVDDGSSYTSKQTVPAGTPLSDTDYWLLTTAKGDTGATPELTIGNVVTLPAGTPATVTITGTPEQPVLNFGIPQGPAGSVSLDDLYALYPNDTVTGSPASFPDGADQIPVIDLQAEINPVQSLNGYSHPWVGGAEKNLLDADRANASLNGIDFTVNKDAAGNVISISASGTATAAATLLLPTCQLDAGTYILSGCPADGDGSGKWRIRLGDSSDVFIGNDTGSGFTFTLPTAGSVTVKLNVELLNTLVNLTFYPMICLSTATDPLVYEPYTNICPITGEAGCTVTVSANADLSAGVDYSVDWTGDEGIVYGGTIDFTTGLLTVDKQVYQFDGTENISMAAQGGYNRFNFYASPITFASDPAASSELCSHYAVNTSVLGGNTVDQVIYAKNNAIMWRDDSIASAADMQTYLAGQYAANKPLQIVAPLASPVAVQLSPEVIETILGQNYVGSTTGSVTVHYRADMSLYILKVTA